jgi:hypothetical protein
VSDAVWKNRKYPTIPIQEGFEDTPCAALRLIYDIRLQEYIIITQSSESPCVFIQQRHYKLPLHRDQLIEMSTLSNGTNGVHRDSGPGKADSPAGKATTPIAIVGMACRFPGNVTSPSQLWELCASGKDGWQPIPESRFDNKSLYHKNYSRAGRVSWQDIIEPSSCN